MSYTQLTQDERYHIQYLSRHCTIAEIAKRDLCKKAFPPTAETQTQVFVYFRP